MVEKRVNHVHREALGGFRQEVLSLGDIGLSLLWVGVTLIGWPCLLGRCALHIMILSLIWAVLCPSVVPVALIGSSLSSLVVVGGTSFIVEPISSALAPSMVTMPRKWTRVRALDPVASIPVVGTAVVAIVPVVVSVVSLLVGVAPISVVAPSLLTIATLVPLRLDVACVLGLVAGYKWILG